MKTIVTLLLILFAHIGFATTYYIGPKGNDRTGNGSVGNPWQSLYIATSYVTKPGDIIHVMAGSYIEKARCILAVGVSIEGDGVSSVIQSTLAERFVAIIIATSPEGTIGNQHISNLKLDGNNRTTSWAIEMRGRSNFSIHDCTISNFDEIGVLMAGRSDNTEAPPNTYATGNTFYNNVLTNCAKYEGFGRGCLNIGGQKGMLIHHNTITQMGRINGTNGWPVKIADGGYLKGLKIYDNIITKQPYSGNYPGDGGWDFAIELFNESGLEIYNNTIQGSIDMNHQSKEEYAYSVYIHDNTIGPQTLNTKMESGIIFEFSTETAIVSNNKIRNVTVPITFNTRSRSVVKNISIINNQIINIGKSGSGHGNEGCAIQLASEGTNDYSLDGLFIYNNTIVANPQDNPHWGIKLNDGSSINNVKIVKNVLENFYTAAIVSNIAPLVNSLVIENNILYGNGNGNNPHFENGTPKNLTDHNNTKYKSRAGSDPGFNFKQQILRPFYYGIKNTTMLEYIAVFAGIISVWFSRKENIYVYPTGLINTIIYIFLSFDQGLLGEASVNFYYTIMSIYGWILWSKRDRKKHRLVRVTSSTKKEWLTQLLFFAAFFFAIFFALTYLKKNFAPGASPWADAFASATAFTGMWLMTKKKVESWYWWIATNIASIPLYFVKHFVFTSVYYGVLLVMAVFGLYEWKKRAVQKQIATNGKP